MTIAHALKSVLIAGTVIASTLFGSDLLLAPSLSARADKPAADAAPAATPASVAVVEERPVATWTKFSGRLEAVDRVEVRSRVPGAVEATHFREGALVAKGDPLVTIDPAPYAVEVARAEAAVSAATARLTFARGETDRGLQLRDNRTMAASEFDRRFQAGLEAEADLAAAEASLATARLNLSYTDIRSPITGRIGRIEVTPGNLISAGAGSPVLASLVSVDPIYASFDADEAAVTRLLASLAGGRAAQDFAAAIPVEMDRPDGGVARGTVQLVDPTVDPVNGTVRIRAAFANPDGALMPGQFARIRLGEPQAGPAVLVSERAVGTDQDKKFVLVVSGDNTAQYREVTLGAEAEGLRIVTAGLSADERVVVNGLQRIRPGAEVAPEIVPMDAESEPSLQASAALDRP